MVKVACPGCQAPYEIDERRIPAAGLKMRCPKCGTSVPVAKPGGEAPAAFAPAPPMPAARPPLPAAPQAAPAMGGFGSLDTFGDEGGGSGIDLPANVSMTGVDLPSNVDSSGGIDLPAPIATGGVDLPSFAPRPARPGQPPQPAAARGGGFGEIDLMGDFAAQSSGGGGEVDLPAFQQPAPFGAIDLPAARPAQQGPPGAPGFAPSPFGGPDPDQGSDLPMVSPAAQGQPGFPGRVPPPPPAAAYGRPGPAAFPQGGFPQPGSQQAGLPAPAAGRAGLPSPAGTQPGLPAYGQQAGLPALGGQSGLPALGGGGLPALGGGLPALGGQLPAVGGSLPSPGGQLPAVGGSLPSIGGSLPVPGGSLPTIGGSLPTVGGTLPAIGGTLPAHQGSSLPSLGGSLPAGLDAFPSIGGQLPTTGAGLPAFGGAGLPEVSGSGLPALQSDGSMGGGFDAPIMGVGGEGIEAPFTGGGGLVAKGAPARAKAKKKDDPFKDFLTPKRKSNILKYSIGVLVFLLLGGALLTLMPRMGPFGLHFISDSLNAKKYDAALTTLRKDSQSALDSDTIAAFTTSIQKADAAEQAAPRHDDTAAYEAFLIYDKSLRFGREGGGEAKAKAILEDVDPKRTSDSVGLAKAAGAALAGQIDQARAGAKAVASHSPADVDASVLVGEIELFGKSPDKALDAFTKAVTSHKSARTLFGLARAQMASGKTSEAEATAKSVLEAAPKHVGARLMLASIASDAQNREGEALELLQKVVSDAGIRSQASDAELVDAYTQLGRLHLAATRLSQAEEAFAAALKLNPQAIAGLIGNGELFYRSGRYSEAETRFGAARTADDSNIDAKIGVAKTWIAQERSKEAKDLLVQVIAANPKDSSAQYWLGKAEEQLGHKKESQAAFEQAVALATKAETGVPAYVGLATLLASMDKAADAQKKLVEAGEKYPNSADLSKARGDIALKAGKYEDAREQYEEALKKSSDDLQTKFQLGSTLRRMRAYDEAAAVFDQIAKVDKDFPNLALERGLYYEETGQVEQATALYAEALKKAPDDLDLKLRVGSTLVIANHAKQAEPILAAVVSQRPNSAEANHFYGRAILLNQGNTADALRYLQKAVDNDPTRAEYHLYVGWAANNSGDATKAEKELTTALQLDSSLAEAYWQDGVRLEKASQTRDAIKQLTTALTMRPSLSQAYATLALCYHDQSNWANEEESLLRAIKGDDKVAEYHNQLARVYVRKGANADAIKEFEKALELAATRDTAPAWLPEAHLNLAEAYNKGPDKAKACEHAQIYKKIGAADSAYQADADAILAGCKK